LAERRCARGSCLTVQSIEPDDLVVTMGALAADWITQGPTVAHLKRALADRAGVKHAVAVASGTAALHAPAGRPA